jgi:ABC-type amino acid transport system permease subunit
VSIILDFPVLVFLVLDSHCSYAVPNVEKFERAGSVFENDFSARSISFKGETGGA